MSAPGRILLLVALLTGCARPDGIWVGWMHIDPPTTAYAAWTPFGTVNNLNECKRAALESVKEAERALKRDGYTNIKIDGSMWTANFPNSGNLFTGQMICLPSTVDPREPKP